MDWKREAADELRNYMNRKAAIANISDQIADLATEITSIRRISFLMIARSQLSCRWCGVGIASTSGYASGAICAPKMRNCSVDAKSGYAQPGKTISVTTGKGKNDE